jgi:hypothetical protein
MCDIQWDLAVPRIFPSVALVIAVVATGLCCSGSPGLAAGGEAPWCIIDSEGNLHCWYADSQSCLQQIASGSRGFCVQNPSGSSAAATQSAPPRRKRR